MESARKRLRYCEHCSQAVTYPVYKKHKEEFYDSTSKQWMVTHRSGKKCSKLFDPSLDAEDDEIISRAISSTTCSATGSTGKYGNGRFTRNSFCLPCSLSIVKIYILTYQC